MVYQGSKTRYAQYIVPILQKTINITNAETFIDGCCGGCNIIQDIKCKNKIAIDLNNDLIELYKYAITAYKEGYLDTAFPTKITKEDWNKAKSGNGESWYRALVCFFASYSARGFSGGYCLNTSRNYYIERLNNFKKQIPKLIDIEFICEDINYIHPSNSIIYIDPPYKNTKKYDINLSFDYELFWDSVRRLSKKNIVFISEQTAPNDFKSIWNLVAIRNCFGSQIKKANECLWVYKDNMCILNEKGVTIN